MIISGNDPKTQVTAILGTDLMPLASIKYSKTTMYPEASLVLAPGAIDRLPELLEGLIGVFGNDYANRLTLVLTEGQALLFAVHMSHYLTSEDPRVVSAWTDLEFELEVVDQGATRPVRVRFVGKNIAGIKRIAKADALKLTITRRGA